MYLGRCLCLSPIAGLPRPVTATGELKTTEVYSLAVLEPCVLGPPLLPPQGSGGGPSCLVQVLALPVPTSPRSLPLSSHGLLPPPPAPVSLLFCLL